MSGRAAGTYESFVGADKPKSAEIVRHRERRRRVRTKLRWPVLIRDHDGKIVESVTENLSSEGFYLYAPTPFMCGDVLHCRITIPSHNSTGADGWLALECRVQVVRSEAGPNGEPFGIACQMMDYRMATSAGS